MGGFIAAAPAVSTEAKEGAPRIVKGPAYGQESAPGPSGAGDWPMYRHDPKRSGSSQVGVGPNVAEKWISEPGGRLTQPVFSGKRLFVARVDAGQVVCLDAETGKTSWEYTTGGRIDSAPSCYFVSCPRTAQSRQLATRNDSEATERRSVFE